MSEVKSRLIEVEDLPAILTPVGIVIVVVVSWLL